MVEAASTPEPLASTPTPTPAEAEPPSPEPTPPPPDPSIPYPTAHCVSFDDLSERWVMRIDPVAKADVRRAERLVDRYPNADGHTGALSRSNLPEAWRELRELTLLSAEGSLHTRVKKVGVRPAPSGGSFAFVLEAKPDDPGTERALALEGHLPAAEPAWTAVSPSSVDTERWASLEGPITELVEGLRPGKRPPGIRARDLQWLDAELGGGVVAIVLVNRELHSGAVPRWAAIAAMGDDGQLRPVPLVQSDDHPPPAGLLEHAFFEPVAWLDLDLDGRPELLLDEMWPEGAFTWIVRVDPGSDQLLAERLCGDAA